MSTQKGITIVHHRNRLFSSSPIATIANIASAGCCHQRQAQAAALRNLPLRSIPSLATAFTLGLSDILSLAPALHAVPSRHPFTWPWAAMGFARAQPAACLALAFCCLPFAIIVGATLSQPLLSTLPPLSAD